MSLVWLDMEMTGLDSERDVPLQIAMVITDDQLKELAGCEVTIWQPDSALERISPFVRKMHTDNGLLEAVRRSEHSLADAERRMMELLSKHCAYREGVLAGNSIHVDRRFIAEYFPVLDGYLHYRMVDVSSLKELIRRWYGAAPLFTKTEGTHTALSDIRESIAELNHYRAQVFKPSGAEAASS